MSVLHIKELRLRNYRSFRDARLPFSDLTFLVGRNASGKSSLLDALDFIREALTDSLPIAIERRGGMEGLRHGLAAEGDFVEVSVVLTVVAAVGESGGLASVPGRDVRLHTVEGWGASRECSVIYGFALSHDGTVGREHLQTDADALPGYSRDGTAIHFFGEQVSWNPLVPSDGLLLPLLGGRGSAAGDRVVSMSGSSRWTLSPTIVHSSLVAMRSSRPLSSSILEGRELASGDVLTPDARNLADVVHQLRERQPKQFSAVLVGLQAVIPGIESIDTVTIAGRRHLQFHQRLLDRTFTFQASSMSEGTLRALALLCALRSSRATSLVAIDEIEDALHVAALFPIIEQALAVTGFDPIETPPIQVILTTHSTEVLSLPMATGERIRVLENRDGASWIFALSPEVLADLHPPETVGALLRINALWPDEHPLVNGPDIFALTA